VPDDTWEEVGAGKFVCKINFTVEGSIPARDRTESRVNVLHWVDGRWLLEQFLDEKKMEDGSPMHWRTINGVLRDDVEVAKSRAEQAEWFRVRNR